LRSGALSQLANHWRASSYVQCPERSSTGTSIPLSTIFGARAGFQHDCRIDDPRWREAVFERGTDADRKNGPAARSFAADAHDCIMVRIQTDLPNTSLRHEDAPQWRAPLGSST